MQLQLQRKSQGDPYIGNAVEQNTKAWMEIPKYESTRTSKQDSQCKVTLGTNKHVQTKSEREHDG